jgi:phage terminase small subunit
MTGNLTPKQNAFCLAYVETGNAAAAYRLAYATASMSAGAVNVEASRLLDHPKVALSIGELRAVHADRHNVTIDDIRRQLDEDRAFAQDCKAPAAAVSATMGLAKLYGLLVEKRQIAQLNVPTFNPADLAQADAIVAKYEARRREAEQSV